MKYNNTFLNFFLTLKNLFFDLLKHSSNTYIEQRPHKMLLKHCAIRFFVKPINNLFYISMSYKKSLKPSWMASKIISQHCLHNMGSYKNYVDLQRGKSDICLTPSPLSVGQRSFCRTFQQSFAVCSTLYSKVVKVTHNVVCAWSL